MEFMVNDNGGSGNFYIPANTTFVNPQVTITYGYYSGENKSKELSFPKPTHVIFSGKMTHVFWTDGSKTSVTWDGKDIFDPEHAVAVAIAHKMFGSKNQFKKFVKEKSHTQESKPTLKQIAKNFVNNTQNFGGSPEPE